MNHSQNYHLFASYIQMVNCPVITNAQAIEGFICSLDAANGISSRKRKILQSFYTPGNTSSNVEWEVGKLILYCIS